LIGVYFKTLKIKYLSYCNNLSSFQVVSLDSPEAMFDYVAPEFVTPDMGGNLEFDANEWTQNRCVSFLIETAFKSGLSG
jgi:hypothetical protein